MVFSESLKNLFLAQNTPRQNLNFVFSVAIRDAETGIKILGIMAVLAWGFGYCLPPGYFGVQY
jgi:hypothetical protein